MAAFVRPPHRVAELYLQQHMDDDQIDAKMASQPVIGLGTDSSSCCWDTIWRTCNSNTISALVESNKSVLSLWLTFILNQWWDGWETKKKRCVFEPTRNWRIAGCGQSSKLLRAVPLKRLLALRKQCRGKV